MVAAADPANQLEVLGCGVLAGLACAPLLLKAPLVIPVLGIGFVCCWSGNWAHNNGSSLY